MRCFSYRNYALGVLLLIHTFSYVDGFALGLVLQSIKADLNLSDTQLGLLSGLAFAAFYSLLGVPLARWADRGNRVVIIATAGVVWSLLVALCGTAKSFWELLLFRVGVAAGEAGCIPPANSLIADYFTRAERPRAAAIYMLGPSLSVVIGYFLAGWLNELFGWRVTFICLGLPGLLPAALAFFTLREPRRASENVIVEETRGATAAANSTLEVWRVLWRCASFRHLLLFFSIAYFFGYGILQWQPTFFVRSHGMATGILGMWFAVLYGLGGILGTYCGGVLAARFAARQEGLQLRAMSVVYMVYGLGSAFIYLTSRLPVAFSLMALTAFGSAATVGPLFATIQTLVPPNMRATAVAIIYLFANLVGLGLGPLAAGALSDALKHVAGEDSLRYALLLLCPGYVWAGWHLWSASTTIVQDLAAIPNAG